MSDRQKVHEIEQLAQELLVLREQKRTLDEEANRWAERRDRLNNQLKSLRAEISVLRTERDRVNDQVKKLKQQRSETTARIHEKTDQTKKLAEESAVLAKRKPSRSHQALQREVEGIDWKIQTTPLTLHEDKELVEKVRQLEIQIDVHKKLEQLTRKIVKLRAESGVLKTENEQRHRELIKRAEKGQEIHGKMLEKIEQSKKLKTEADTMHKRFLEAKEKTKPLQDDIARIADQIRQFKNEIQKEEEIKKKQNQDALRETLEKQARAKLKRGEKLSWEEFQLLAEKGMTAQD